MTIVSAKPPFEITATDNGLRLEPVYQSYLRTGQDFEFEVHVFNSTDGGYIVSDTSCYIHIYGKGGTHLFEGYQDVVAHDFDYSFDVAGGNFSDRGEYQAKLQCNHTSGVSGAQQIIFMVNDYGEELSEAESHTFNMSMIFLMVLFVLAMIGIFSIDNYIGKFSLYWVAHLLFIVGTFSVWQFNQGYAISFFGLAGIWKILFYVATISAFPMIILSLAWIFYIHTFNEHFQKVIDNGGNSEDAFRLAKRKSGGWFNGK